MVETGLLMNWNIVSCDSPDELAAKAAAHFVRLISHPAGGLVALAGGSSPAGMYKQLASDTSFAYQAQGANYLFIPGDERSVPVDDPDSNSGAIYKALIKPCGLESQWQEISVASDGPETVACNITRLAGERLEAPDFPAPRIVLLGMGEDGHTASLFPGSSCLHETSTGFCATFVASKDTWRISLTPQSILEAEEVILLVNDENKAAAFAQAQKPGDISEIPTRLLHKRTKPTTVYTCIG